MRERLYPFIVFMLPFAVYLPTAAGTFYYDDNVIFFGHQVFMLAQNPFLVFKADAMHMVPGAPRSIHVFFLMLLYKVFGANPLPYHIFNLALHSLTTLFVFLFMKEITSGMDNPSEVSLIGALIFGLHPIHVENITFITLGGTDLFYTLWAMLSLILYAKFRTPKGGVGEGRGRKYLFLLFSLIAFYFSVLSKESAISFVLLFPLTEFLLGRKGFVWALPYGAIVAFLKLGFVKEAGAFVSSGGNGGMGDVLKSLGFFIKSLLIPYPQSVIIKEFGEGWLIYGFIVLSIMALAVLLLKIKDRRLIIYAFCFFLTASFPYLFVPFIKGNIAITAERYIYAPSVGFSIGLAVFLHNAFNRRRHLLRPAVALLLAAYGAFGLWYFYRSWRTEEAFWSNVIKTNPEYVTGYGSLASIELGRGNVGKAHALLLKGLSKQKGLPAEFSQAAFSLGEIAKAQGDLSRAEMYYTLSLRYGPYEFSFIELGYLYLNVGNLTEARRAFEGALGFPSRNIRAVYGLAKTLFLMGERDSARLYAWEVLRRTKDPALGSLASELLK